MALYDLRKQVHSLSVVSNMCFGLKETPEKIQEFATQTVTGVMAIKGNLRTLKPSTKELLGDYKPVWGPVVWSNKDQGANTVCDNNMFLAYWEEKNRYVLAIAGTNINSLYGWFVEDFRTGVMVDWTEVSPNAPSTSGKIALGTSKGIDALLNKMVDGDKGTIIDFLKKQMATATPGASLSVGGHSLGGTLTPVMATYLLNTKESWDPKGNVSSINAYPTAGATPGNETFAGYVESLFVGENDYYGAYNPIDVVPHGWQADMMAKVPTLYADFKNGIPKPKLIALAVQAALLMTKGKEYQQITTFHALKLVKYVAIPEDDVQKAMDKIPKTVKAVFKALGLSLENHLKFMIELGIQHVTAYSDWMLGIESFCVELYQPYLKEHKPSTATTMEDAAAESITSLSTSYKEQAEEVEA